MNALLETTSVKDALGVIWNTVGNWAINVGIKIIIAIVLLVVSFRIITVISRKIEKKGDKDKYDKTIMKTLAYIFNIGAKVLVTVCLVGYLGIDTSGITALIASLGVCFGLAVNGAVANIAGGVLIIVTRPFRVDDFIEAQGVSGTVEDIHMTATKIRTVDNKIIYVPNGALANGNIINYSEKDTRRVDFIFSISYSSDCAKAQKLLLDLLSNHPLKLEGSDVYVGISKYGASSIDIAARAWVKSGDYWTLNREVLEAVKPMFDANGIEIPFDQLDVHIRND